MTSEKNSDTLIIQAFVKQTTPPRIQRCLDSVRKWAGIRAYDYTLAGDEFYDLCGHEFLQRGQKNPRAITNLATLFTQSATLRSRWDCDPHARSSTGAGSHFSAWASVESCAASPLGCGCPYLDSAEPKSRVANCRRIRSRGAAHSTLTPRPWLSCSAFRRTDTAGNIA